MTTTIQTRTPTPVKVVFRYTPRTVLSSTAITGELADLVKRMSGFATDTGTDTVEDVQDELVWAILPYHPLPEGEKSNDMVAVLLADGTREVHHWPTLIKDTTEATPEQYARMMADMEDNGYEVEPITARQVNALLRRAERPVVSAERQASTDEDFEVEDISIDGSFTGDLDAWNNSTFQEDWA